MHDDDMPTGSELFESDARVGRQSFLALASTLLIGLFAGASAHAATATKASGGRDAKRRKKAAASTTQSSSKKIPGGHDMRKRKAT